MKKYLELAKTNYQYVGIGVVVVLICIFYFSQGGPPKQQRESPDTYIPSGFVLVPIEVVNRDALESLLGDYGVVDLFVPSPEPNKLGKKVASRVKILRAPLNPEQFAVLVREGESAQLVLHESQYFVVIQNPKQRGTEIVKPISRRSRISYEDG